MPRLDFSKSRIVWLAAPAMFCLAVPYAPAARANTGGETQAAAGGQTSGAQTPANGAAAPAPKSADLVDALQTALTQAKQTLTAAQADRDKALKIISAMPPVAPKDTDLNADVTKRLAGIAQALSEAALTADALKKSEDALRKDIDPAAGLPKAKQDLTQARRAVTPSVLDALTDASAKSAAKDAVAAADSTLKDIDAVTKDIQEKALGAGVDASRPTALHDAAQGNYAFAAGLFKLLKVRLDNTGLPTLKPDEKADAVRAALAGSLGAEVGAETLRPQLQDAWDKLAKQLQSLFTGDDRKETDVTAAETTFDDADKTIASHIEAWLTTLQKGILSQGDDVKKASLDLRAALDKKPRDETQVIAAPALLNAVRAQAADVALIVANERTLLPLLQKRGFPLGQAQALLDPLKAADDILSTQAEILEEVLSGDRERFVQDQMRLFYFTDVPRLLYALNSNVQRKDPANADKLKNDFDAKRKELLDTEDGIVEANAQINAAAQQLLAIQEDLRRTNAQVTKATSDAQGAQSRLASLTRLQDLFAARKKNLQTRLDNLNTQQAAATTANQTAQAQTLQNQIAQTQEQIDRTGTQSDQQQKIVAQVTQQQKDLQDQQDALKEQVKGFQAQQADARKKLVDMQTAQARNRVQAQRLSQDEVQAFGDANAHGAFYYTEPIGSSTDPVKRVILVGYDDSKVIYLRGLPKDVERVKELIAGYDRPAPQARVTLWTLQMNGSDLNALNASLKKVEDVLRDLRGSIIGVQDVLRDSISEEVNRVAQVALKTRFGTNQTKIPCYKAPTGETYRNYNPNPPLQERDRLARYFFYSREVRQALGFPFVLESGGLKYPDIPALTPSYQDYADVANLTRWTLPDPVHATTLGEMLFVLSLGKVSSRINILNRFANEVNARFASNPTPDIAPIPTSNPMPGSATVSTGGKTASQGTMHPSQKQALADFAKAAHMIATTSAGEGPIEGKDYDSDKDDVIEIKPSAKPEPSSLYPAFLRTLLGLLVDSPAPSGVPNNGLNANQLEILSALQAKSREAVSAEMRRLLAQIDALENRSDDSITKLRKGKPSYNPLLLNRRYDSDEAAVLREQYFSLLGWLYRTLYIEDRNPEHDYAAFIRFKFTAAIRKKALPLPLPPEASYNPDALFDPYPLMERVQQQLYSKDKSSWDNVKIAEDGLRALDMYALNIVNLTQQRNSLAEATPRVAAADDMIKRMIIVAEDDLDYYFVQPAFDVIRKANTKVQLGVINRESMLVTNRQISRLDPRASANLNLAGGTDFLQEATQLGQIVNGVQDNQRFRDAQRQEKLQTTLPLLGGGLAARLGETTGNYFALGGLLALFSDLASKPQNSTGEIYSLNSGSLFQITPIFDPSGQALRFHLNYQAGTRIQSPFGTTTPALPNVDRQSLNTDVEISNLEFREISRFEANARVGLPEQRSGGVPILKEVPILRDIPILGYFYRRKASAAVRQESILFAQTSLYPTIGDIVDVLSDVPLRFDLNRETPGYLQPPPPETPKPELPTLVINALTFDPAPVIGGSPTVGTVTLSAPAPKDTPVTIYSGDDIVPTAPKSGDAPAKPTETASPAPAVNQRSNPTGARGANTRLQGRPASPPSSTSTQTAGATGGTPAKEDPPPVISPTTQTQTILIPKGQASAVFALKTHSVNQSVTTVIKAYLNGITKVALLTVKPPDKSTPAVPMPAIKSVTFTPGEAVSGDVVTVTVELAAPATDGGAPVTLTVKDIKGINQASVTPGSSRVEAKQTKAVFSIQTPVVTNNTPIIVTATCGKTSTTQAFVLKPKAAPASKTGATLPFPVKQVLLTRNNDQTYTVTVILQGVAPAGGTKVQLTVDPPLLALDTIPVTVPANSSLAQTQVSSKAQPAGKSLPTQVRVKAKVGSKTQSFPAKL